MYALLLSGSGALITNHAIAQDPAGLTYEENARVDSVGNANEAAELKEQNAEAIKYQNERNAESLSDLKSKKKDTRTKAKEARRVEQEASDAARDSRLAYRSEKNAQKGRKQADKQAKEAAKSRGVSDRN